MGIFADGAVAREFAHAGSIQDRHFRPMGFVAVGFVHEGVGIAVGLEVGENHKRVASIEQTVAQGGESAGFIGAEVVGADPVHDGADFLVGVVVVVGFVAFGGEGFDFLDSHAEDEDVLFTNFLEDFDISAVECADGESAIERELHVARAGGLFARGRDLFGDVGSRDDALGEGDAVVGQEDHFQLAADAWVIVDDGTDGVDGFDDALG